MKNRIIQKQWVVGDVQPFLFHAQDARTVELFRDYIAQAALN